MPRSEKVCSFASIERPDGIRTCYDGAAFRQALALATPLGYQRTYGNQQVVATLLKSSLAKLNINLKTQALSFERYLKSGSGHAFAKRRLW